MRQKIKLWDDQRKKTPNGMCQVEYDKLDREWPNMQQRAILKDLRNDLMHQQSQKGPDEIKNDGGNRFNREAAENRVLNMLQLAPANVFKAHYFHGIFLHLWREKTKVYLRPYTSTKSASGCKR